MASPSSRANTETILGVSQSDAVKVSVSGMSLRRPSCSLAKVMVTVPVGWESSTME